MYSKTQALLSSHVWSAKKTVAKTHYAPQCDQCDQWVHYKCEGLTRKQYLELENDRLTTWFCNKCKLPNVITATSTLHLATSNFYQPRSDTTTGIPTLLDGYSRVNDNQHTTGTTDMRGTDDIRLIPRPTRRREHKLKIMTVNCCILRSTGKRLDFASILHEHQPDIICGTENHLDNSITTSEIFPKGFDIFRKDRSLGGEEFLLLCLISM